MVTEPGLLRAAECAPIDAAVDAANRWINENKIKVVNVETVVLPNIWSRYEDGSTDTALGTSGDSPSHWYQFVRVWYRTE